MSRNRFFGLKNRSIDKKCMRSTPEIHFWILFPMEHIFLENYSDGAGKIFKQKNTIFQTQICRFMGFLTFPSVFTQNYHIWCAMLCFDWFQETVKTLFHAIFRGFESNFDLSFSERQNVIFRFSWLHRNTFPKICAPSEMKSKNGSQASLSCFFDR